MRCAIVLFFIVLALLAPVLPAAATDYVWTFGAAPDNAWDNEDNWSELSGYPDGPEDTAEIPFIDDDPESYPEIDFGSAQTGVLTLRKENGGDGGAMVRLVTTNAGLTVLKRNGLVVEENAQVRVEASNAEFELSGGGRIMLDGRIAGEGGRVVLGGGHSYITVGSGMLLGDPSFELTTPADDYRFSTLVLGPGTSIRGGVTITLPLVNNGLVDPDHPDGGAPYAIHLICAPKIGAGDWKVSCTDGQACTGNTVNRLIVETPVVGSGDLIITRHGIAEIRRHFSLYGILVVTGELAGFLIDENVMFDVDRYTFSLCPQ